MTWRVVCASEVGTSHLQSGTPCQDSCWAQVETSPSNEPLLSIFVADGAGSAARGGEGAELAIEAATGFVADCLKQSNLAMNEELANNLIEAIRESLFLAADNAGATARDFACTFIAVLSSRTETLVLQVGDGGVVVDAGEGLEVAIVPMASEYVNMTHFVTDADAMSILATKIYPEHARRVAVFSDGIQRLALNMADNTPHEPFFAPFFEGLSKATLEQESRLQELLMRFLGSATVNDRTDDDKTLALATWLL